MNLGYVCTNYNNAAVTWDAVCSLLAATGASAQVVVVDNQSGEGDREELRRLQTEQPRVEVVFSDENLGYFPGLNAGLRRLRARHPETNLVVAGNNDLLFPPDFSAQLDAKRKVWTEHAVVSPNIITLDGVHQNPHVISDIGWKRQIMYDLYHSSYPVACTIRHMAQLTRRFTARGDEEQWAVPRAIHQGHGSCYILGPRFLREFGELWAPTFLLGEEYFLSKQLQDNGQSVYYEPGIVVRHCCHAAIAKVPGRQMWEYSCMAHRIYRRHVGIFGPVARR
jgi:GT2 family glycosyltransferase